MNLLYDQSGICLQDVFQLIVSTFSGLGDISGPSFERRVVILETLARYRSCVVMLDLECDDLVRDMFSTFFAVARYGFCLIKFVVLLLALFPCQLLALVSHSEKLTTFINNAYAGRIIQKVFLHQCKKSWWFS